MITLAFPSHIEWLISNRAEELSQAMKKEKLESIQDILSIMMAADPTAKKLCVQWLCDCWITGGFRWEDIAEGKKSKVYDTLVKFAENRNNLQGEQRNLSYYSTLASVYRSIKPFLIKSSDEHIPGIREIKRKERELAWDQSQLIYRDNNMIIAVPLTEKASVWWGRGTRWCTASSHAESINYFDDYNQKAPLIVISLKNKDGEGWIKLQFYVSRAELCFMDESDEEVELLFIHKYWDQLAPLMEWAVEQNGKILKFFPRVHKTEQICKTALNLDCSVLWFIPPELGISGIYQWIVENEKEALKYISVDYKTKELAEFAINKYPEALKYIPQRLKTMELCKRAVEADSLTLRFVPDRLKTTELCRLAIDKNGKALLYVPNTFKSYDLCLSAVKNQGKALAYVPEHMRTEEMHWKAIEDYAEALAYIPINLLNEELCMLALSKDGKLLALIPDEMKTDKMYWIAVKSNGCALRYIPVEKKTPELCYLAIKQNGLALYYVLPQLITADICWKAVENNALALEAVPESFKTPELCWLAVKRDPIALDFVPEPLLTKELCLLALEQNPDLIYLVPESFRKTITQKQNKIEWDRTLLNGLIEKYSMLYSSDINPLSY